MYTAIGGRQLVLPAAGHGSDTLLEGMGQHGNPFAGQPLGRCRLERGPERRHKSYPGSGRSSQGAARGEADSISMCTPSALK